MRNSLTALVAIVSVALSLRVPAWSAGSVAKPGAPGAAVKLGAPANAVKAVPGLGVSAIPGAVQHAAASPKAEAATPASVSARVEAMAERFAAAAENAGDIGKATGEQAGALGQEAEKALTGETPAPAPVAAEPAAPVPPAPAAAPQLNAEQTKKIRTLKAVAELFMDHYAPVDWKKLGRDVDLLKNYQAIRAQIEAKPDMTQTEFRRLLKGYVEALQDYHVGISFHATESAKLPFSVVGAEGRYFIVDVDREALGDAKFPFQPGDEITSWDGKPVGDVVKTLLPSIQNTAETDQRLAEMFLTARSARRAMEVPKGQVVLGIKRVDGSVHEAKLDWIYRAENIPQEIPTGGENLGPENVDLSVTLRQGPSGRLASLRKLVREFMAPLIQIHPEAEWLAQQPTAENGFTIGARKSFVPELGKVVWPATEREKAAVAQLPFNAYIYENEQGQKIGFIRIPDYMAGGNVQMAAQVFGGLIRKFQQSTDGLVIDQVNNPGGNMFYTYTLLSLLSDKPMKVPPHLVMLNQSHGRMAAEILREAENPSMKQMLERALSQEIMSFTALPTADENPVVKFARYILDRLKRAQDEKNPKLLLTDPLDLFGVSEIDPQPMAHYTKPIVVLVNELDFSGGDFFPAILKDNARATIFGVRTSGAGGAVMSQSWANRFGIEQITYTWTLAVRAIGQVLENLGVTPDVQYQLTAADLQNGLQGYKKAVNDTIKAKVVSAFLAGQAPAPAVVQGPAAPRPASPFGPMSLGGGIEQRSDLPAAPTLGVDPKDEANKRTPAPKSTGAPGAEESPLSAFAGVASFFGVVLGLGAFAVWVLDPVVRVLFDFFLR